MTRKSSDEHMEEINISDAPIRERHHHHHSSRRGHRDYDAKPLDEEALNEDLHNVISDYWKDRQKPGFVGYKTGKAEDEEIRVVVHDESASEHSFVDRITGKVMKESSGSEDLVEEKPSDESAEMDTELSETGAETEEKGLQGKEAGDLAPGNSEDDLPEGTTIRKSEDGTVTVTETVVKRKHVGKKKGKKKTGPGRVFKWACSILLLLVLCATVSFAVMRYVGWKNSTKSDDSGEDISMLDGVVSEDGGKTVVYKGVTYTFNEDLSTILFIGVDQEEYEQTGVSGEAGQADTVILTTVNQKTGETRMIPLSRSTMVAVDQYNTDGSYWKQENVQLAVSFAYGTNIDENCKNVAKAVSRILYGMPVHRYVTMDLSAIPQLNDAVGGVTVKCLEDMTDVDETWVKDAEITLHGKQAETYVRHRKTTVSEENQDNNAPRMERQKQYMDCFIHTLLTRMKGDVFVPLRLYREVGDDIYSDVTTSEIVYYTSMVVSKGFNNSVLSIPGTVKHNEFTEFYPDDEKLYQMILDTFYERQ